MSKVLDRLVKNDHRIMSCDYFGSYNTGGDGYFMYINDGYYCGSMGMATIAEYTVTVSYTHLTLPTTRIV